MPLDPEIQKIVDDAVAAAVNETREHVKTLFEETNSGLVKKRDELLNERKQGADRIKELKAENERLKTAAQADRLYDKFKKGELPGQTPSPHALPDGAIRATENEMFVPRDLVRDPAQYRRLKEAAEERKLTMRIVDQAGSFDPNITSPAVHEFEHKGTVFMSSERIEEIGGPNGYQRLRAENPTKRYHAFKTLDQLSDEARAAHDKLAGGTDA